jgi:hypothetical protein
MQRPEVVAAYLGQPQLQTVSTEAPMPERHDA